MVKALENSEDETLDNVVAESGSAYSSTNKSPDQLYINPFVDWAFKRIFASEAHKEVIMAFLNEVLKGRRQIQSIVYTKNEYPGEIEEEGGCVFDFACTDFDGTSFLVEVQKQKQEHFKERSLFYAGRLLSDQAPKGDKRWKYKLKEVYSISLLEGFCLPDTSTGAYQHNVCLCNASTGQPFYDKLHFIYIEVLKFTKKEAELKSALDQWLYALKHAATMRQKPLFLNAPELTTFFELANYAKLTKEERNMYRTAQQREWDNYSILDYAKKEGREAGLEEGRLRALAEKKEIARNLKIQGVDIKIISATMGLPIDEIVAL
ncbi:MAG: Rpn family recombination-promoting nuclease/putative transposase [Pedobacter sp.]|nr:MAG: Rpn family recombination-promoting nuclease/putative transposase [Pedobacter sp.]